MIDRHSPLQNCAAAPPTALDLQGQQCATRETGFILIPVLFVLALLAVVTLTLTKTVATDVKVGAQILRQAEAASLADGIARLVVRRLTLSDPDVKRKGPIQVDGTPLSCRVSGLIATVSVKDTAGQVDLNLASQDLLDRLFVGLGVPPDQAARLAAAIVDFRDPDSVLSAGGAEAAEYAQAGLSHGPKNAAFASVGELDQVLGMTPAIMALVRPHVTVYSRSRGVDLNVASEAIRALDLPAAPVSFSVQRSFSARVGLRHALNTHVVREFTVELAPRLAVGYLLREWGRGVPAPDVVPQGGIGDLPLCLDLLVPGDG